MKNYLFSVLLFFSPLAFACRYADIPTVERIAQAKEVYFGYVTAIHLLSFEEERKNNDLFIDNLLIIGSDLKKYRVIVKETFKGRPRESKEIVINWCGGGEAELGSRVVIYISTSGNYIETLDENLYKAIKASPSNPSPKRQK
jgi:hypothetical protein